SPAALVLVGSPGDGHREIGRLFAAEEERRPVEEDADPAARAEELEAAENLQAVDAPVASEAVQRLVETDADVVRGKLAEVLEDQEQQPALELDVEDDVRLAWRPAVLRDGSGHGLSLVLTFRGRAARAAHIG